jgi:hypothetical protein
VIGFNEQTDVQVAGPRLSPRAVLPKTVRTRTLCRRQNSSSSPDSAAA